MMIDDDIIQEDNYIDDMQHMLDDIRAGTFVDVPQDSTPMPNRLSIHVDGPAPSFDQLLEDARRPLFDGCTEFSELSFVVKLLHIKSIGGWSIKSFDMLLDLLRSAFLNALLPQSNEKSRSLERGLGFKYHKIHACPNDCILYWKENAALNECPVCKALRWIPNTNGPRAVPQKVLRHFPLKPRLQRLFMSAKIAGDMRWHKEQQTKEDTCMRHPADSECWKKFDEDHGWFASDPRNVRLGLASDGFIPFNNLAKPHSIWPMILVPYNLPPWSCIKDQFFMTSLIIPGPRSPGNEIDVYLQLLIDELLNCGKMGYLHMMPQLRRRLCCMLPYCGQSMIFLPMRICLAGQQGKLACPSCNADTNSNWLKYGRKHCYMGHRRFLPPDHIWRRRKGLFNGREDHRMPPRDVGAEEIQNQLQMIGDVQFVRLRHNLDVMHIEKNIADNILFTLMNSPGKSKDNINSRRDLELLGYRKELHLRRDDGFASNISNCVSRHEYKISGLKSHDYHVFLQRLLPIAAGGYVRSDIGLALTELGTFFKELCARTLDVNLLAQLQTDVVTILCKLEMIFPPSFFDVMVHLAVHLPHEARLGGPVQYRWMYSFERYLGKFKRYVKNKARPEGSIAEAYIHTECLIFCSTYLKDIETRFSRPDRNIDADEEETLDGFKIFNQKVRPLGMPSNVQLEDKLFKAAIWEHYEKCKVQHSDCIHRTHQTEFSTWFKQREHRTSHALDVSADLYALACGPDRWVATYAACIINEKKFHTKQRELRRHIQNFGVVVTGDEATNNLDLYGVINNIVELRYMKWRRVYLFECDWFDVGDRKRGVRVDDHMISVNMNRNWYKDEPFVLASQADQCFYIRDLRAKGNWGVVQNYANRNVYNILPLPRVLEDIDGESSTPDADQENEPSYYYEPVQCDNTDQVATQLNRPDILPSHVDA
ncbi:uncharacterized protein LOC121240926 [Juglans microcarpa x Juglans regia]|uniref:uncharacterized protein LOC121240926 n=1 Tax=Juglans microcarpa x Juglans regia TaxID=2249226 RepID=UPI001B7F3CAF|nr:uncharacterized protein LOC121240926 [Juglans microcarpa x Juglans regia]